jgi:hypothetical protein
VLTQPSYQHGGELGFRSVRVRVALFHRARSQLFVARPFLSASSGSHSSGWTLPETHQDVRGGETLGFAAKRLMMTAFGVEIDHAGVLLIEHDAAASSARVAPRVTLLAFVDGEPLAYTDAQPAAIAAAPGDAPLFQGATPAMRHEAMAAAAAAAGLPIESVPAPAAAAKAPWLWVDAERVRATLLPADVDAVSAASSWARAVTTLESLARELSVGGGEAAVASLHEVGTSEALVAAPSAAVAARHAVPLMDLCVAIAAEIIQNAFSRECVIVEHARDGSAIDCCQC